MMLIKSMEVLAKNRTFIVIAHKSSFLKLKILNKKICFYLLFIEKIAFL